MRTPGKSGNEANLSPFLAFLNFFGELAASSMTHLLVCYWSLQKGSHLIISHLRNVLPYPISQPSFPFFTPLHRGFMTNFFPKFHTYKQLFLPVFHSSTQSSNFYLFWLDFFSHPLGYKLVKRWKLALLSTGSKIIPV